MKRAGLLALAAACLLLHAWQYRGFFIDDAFLSLRYAARFAAGRGLTFTDGERVEGYSNLLWVLLCAVGLRIGIAGVVVARILGVASALAAIGATATAWRKAAPIAYAALALAASMSLATWAIGGLETALVAALVAWGLSRSWALSDGETTPFRAGIPWALLCWTRPDGALLVAAVALGMLLARVRMATILKMAALSGAAVVIQMVFRLLYYGEFVPNTAVMKLGLGAARAGQGLRYVELGALGMLGLLLPAAVAFVVGARRRIIIAATALVIWVGYVVVIGGDWMPAHRMLMPALVIIVFLGGETISALISRGGDWAIRGGVLAVASLGFFAVTQPYDSEAPGGKHAWVWDSRTVGEALERGFGAARPLVALESAGALAYYSKLPALDLMGLCDRHIARSPPIVANGLAGHDRGDGKYALDRAPDMAIFCGAVGAEHACYPSGQQMQADPRWREWTLVRFDIDHRDARIWFRRSSPLIAVRTPSEITVAAWTTTVAHLDDQGPFVDVPANGTHTETIQLPAGHWTLTDATATVSDFTLPSPASVDVHLPGPQRLRRLTFTKTD